MSPSSVRTVRSAPYQSTSTDLWGTAYGMSVRARVVKGCERGVDTRVNANVIYLDVHRCIGKRGSRKHTHMHAHGYTKEGSSGGEAHVNAGEANGAGAGGIGYIMRVFPLLTVWPLKNANLSRLG